MAIIRKLIYLSRLECKAWLRKLYSDFARELTIFVCATVILFLFFYVFKDLLEQESMKLSSLSGGCKNVGVFGFSGAVAYFYVAKITRRSAFTEFQRQSGVVPNEIAIWACFRSVLLFFTYSGIGYLCVRELLSFQNLFAYGVVFATSGVFWSFLAWWSSMQNRRWAATTPRAKRKRAFTLQSWREMQIFTKNSACRLSLASAFLAYLLFGLISFQGVPVVLLLLSALVVGLFCMVALALQLQKDCEHLWLEHSSGVSQERYLQAYNRIALKMFFSISSLVLMTFTIHTDFGLSNAVKVLACLATPLALFSSYAFLLDPKKPLLQIMIIMLVSLFIITTIYIHVLGVVLIPAAAYYGYQHQIGFLYRIPPC